MSVEGNSLFFCGIGIMGCVYCFKHLRKIFYVGSTKNPIKRRISAHKHSFKTECDYLVYCYMRDHMLNFDTMDIEVLMDGVSQWNLEWVEQNYIDEYQPETNMINPMWKKKDYPKYRYDWIERRYNFNYELPFSQLDSS